MSAQNTSGMGSNSGGSGGMSSQDQMSMPSRRRGRQFTAGAAIGLGVVLLMVGIGGGYGLGAYLTKTNASTVDVTEAGSTLLEPMVDIWGPAYTSNVNSHVTLSPAGGGSGAGQSESEGGTIDIGASDAYTASNLGVVDIPVAISSQLVVYNLGASFANIHVNLNGTIVAEIYNGTITSWTDPMILHAQNHKVVGDLLNLTTTTITPIVRSDASGDTNLISTYCDMSYAKWDYGNKTSAFSSVAPANGFQSGNGNSGVLVKLAAVTGSIGYVGISYLTTIKTDNLGWANLGDQEANTALGGDLHANATAYKNYIGWDIANVTADANMALANLNYAVDGLAINLILGGSPAGPITWHRGAGGTVPATGVTPYPDTNLEYTLIKTSPSSPSHQAYVVQFEQWVISYGQSATYLDQVNFVPLTTEIQGLDQQSLSGVTISG